MLRGQYAHSVGCYHEATFHYIEAVKLTESKAMQVMCQVYAAVSYICIGDAESYSQDLQEARNRLAKGLQLTHSYLGNLQLISQYLTILGSLALALHDTAQAREILRSSLTLAKKLSDIPTQIWVLSILTGLYKELGERGNEMENVEYQTKKTEDLRKRLAEAHASIHHIEMIDKVRFEVHHLHELDIKRAMADPTLGVNLDIPESIGLSAPLPIPSSSTLVDIDINSGRRRKRRI